MILRSMQSIFKSLKIFSSWSFLLSLTLCFSNALASDENLRLSIAASCDGETLQAGESIKVSPLMVSISGQSLCVVPSTRIALTNVNLRTEAEKFDTVAIEINFDVESRARFLKSVNGKVGKRMILEKGKFALLEFVIGQQDSTGVLRIVATNSEQAQSIIRALTGD